MKKVAVMIADGTEEIEALTVVDVMRRANIKCDIVSVNGREIKSSHNIEILADKNLSDKEKIILSIILFLSKENNNCFCTNGTISE